VSGVAIASSFLVGLLAAVLGSHIARERAGGAQRPRNRVSTGGTVGAIVLVVGLVQIGTAMAVSVAGEGNVPPALLVVGPLMVALGLYSHISARRR
jgi:hypothetical protein